MTGGGADSGILETDLRKIIKDVSLAAREEHVGLAVLIDEARSYSERFQFTRIERLSPTDARNAIGLDGLDNGFFRARWDRVIPAENPLRSMHVVVLQLRPA
ncbi:hypothetical protein [Acidipropionibacterium virtanenii]|uniref:Uncharacterized protein n=1 Tax=Acidipropionibacterium virtanenii TaxID=2057246 RepID=A0A344UXY9_9ACTN|nr:hypothetical protein [Acidipropionibacterium virtanenii]AXE40137.1 hypothetical protein JS278_03003 [Acidipropionibacterium virtanenii]